MKVLHISTSDYGGAGMAALRLHLSLSKIGVDSKFLCLENSSSNLFHVYKHPSIESNHPSMFKRVLRKLNIGVHLNDKIYSQLKNAVEDLECFSTPLSNHRVHFHPLVQEADIIHLHWISNFIDYPSFFKSIEKPIVWTLHDFNPDQGGLHLQYDKKNLSNPILNKYEEELVFIKRGSIKNKNYVLVSPSSWFQKQIRYNVLSEGAIKVVINHGVDENVFKPLDKNFSRDVLSLSRDELVFVCVASSLNRKAKGFDLLISSLDLLAREFKFTLLAVGNESIINRPYLKYLGRVDNESLLAMVYSAADAFLSSSYEESFCLSAAEAQMCGLPLVSTPVGIMKDIVEDGYNGYLSKSFEPEEFKDAIKSFILNVDNFSGSLIRKLALSKFSLLEQTKKYYDLYKNIF